MSFDEFLLSLQPAHAPAAPRLWPPAPGYWIAAAIAIAVIAGAYWWRTQRRSDPLFQRAKSELDAIAAQHEVHGNDAELAIALSRWLRKVTLLAFPQQPVAGASGDRWLEFLDRSVTGSAFTQGVGRVFARDVYGREISVAAAPLMQLCDEWLTGVRAALEQADRQAPLPKQ